MKLKLSTLIVIIGLIFVGYYYFIFTPCQAASIKTVQEKQQQPHYIPHQPEGVTMLDLDYPDEDMYENFEVTPLDGYDEGSRQAIQSTYDSSDIYDLAGNVRPDNVMHVDEPVALL